MVGFPFRIFEWYQEKRLRRLSIPENKIPFSHTKKYKNFRSRILTFYPFTQNPDREKETL